MDMEKKENIVMGAKYDYFFPQTKKNAIGEKTAGSIPPPGGRISHGILRKT